MIEFIVWSIRLWLVGYRERAQWRYQRITANGRGDWPLAILDRLVDRLSPFDRTIGYRRQSLRRFFWIASHLPSESKRGSLQLVLAILNRFLPYTGPGKYESMDAVDALKVEWLDEHIEYADRQEGSIETLFVALFLNLDVPWSRTGESWILAVDSQGFVTGFQPDDPKATFEQYVAAYMGGDEDIEDEADEPWSNREGQPEFNGAFR